MSLFLHSCNTPDKVVKVLGHMGLSIGLSSVHRAIKSLSAESADYIKELGQTRLVSLAYDNFDVKFNTLVPTVDSPGNRLVHMTSATILQLDHGVSLQDLRCSEYIWNRQDLHLNPRATDPQKFSPLCTLELIHTLHPESVHPSGLSRRGRFNSFKFMETLLTHGPKALHCLLPRLGRPEAVEKIPVTKLKQQPLRALDINPSTVGGNIEILEQLLGQMGFGDPSHSYTDIEDFVQITHSDLGTVEHILSALKQRSVEGTPLRRLQNIVVNPGLFHVKMATLDALWRIFVRPNKMSKVFDGDETSFMKFVAILRPNQTYHLGTNPKFREQHELIDHVGTALRLDAWRTELLKRYDTKYQTLEDFAASQPGLDKLRDIANSLAWDYVAYESSEDDAFDLRFKPAEERDEQNENMKYTQAYILLYEELCYLVNYGDIGRFETLLPAWIPIWRATGKHKYGNRMLL